MDIFGNVVSTPPVILLLLLLSIVFKKKMQRRFAHAHIVIPGIGCRNDNCVLRGREKSKISV